MQTLMLAGSGVCRMTRIKLDFVVKFFGRLVRVRASSDMPARTDGLAVFQPREVRIHPRLRGEDFFETLLHECLHHAADHLDEEWATQLGREFTAILYRPEVLARCRLKIDTPE